MTDDFLSVAAAGCLRESRPTDTMARPLLSFAAQLDMQGNLQGNEIRVPELLLISKPVVPPFDDSAKNIMVSQVQ